MKNLFLAATVLVLAACAKTPDVDYDKTVDFTTYKTFAWLPEATLAGTGNYQISELTEKRVQDAVTEKLQQQGMTLVPAADADVLINYHASVDTKMDVETFNTGYGAHWNNWGMGYNTQTTTREYDVGTLVLDVVDQNTNQLIWRGAREGRLLKNQSPEARNERINEVVTTILSGFPPETVK